MTGKSFTAVLDVDQMMYRFAGAAPEVMTFEVDKYFPEIETFMLDVNYRSTGEIVERQMQLIGNNYTSAGGPYPDKFLKTVSARPGAEHGDKITFAEFAGPQDEARAVVAGIQEDLAAGIEPGQIFVGARTRAQLGYLEGPLVRAQVPYVNIAGGSFWTLKHIADVVAYVKVAFDKSDKTAFQRVYNIASKHNVAPWGDDAGQYCHHRFLGKAFLAAVGESYAVAEAAHFGGGQGLRRSFLPGLEDLVMFVMELQAELAEGLGQAIAYVIDECYTPYMRVELGLSDDEDLSLEDDLETLAELASSFEDAAEFFKFVADATKAAQAAKDKDTGAYVVLSTVHRLKGLERDVVYGIGISEGEDIRTGEPRGLLPHTFSLMPPPNDGVFPGAGMGRIEDERCIMFVLVSRARNAVHLSSVRRYRNSKMGPSRFVHELGLYNG